MLEHTAQLHIHLESTRLLGEVAAGGGGGRGVEVGEGEEEEEPHKTL